MGFAPWQGATRCTSGPTPGAKALMSYALDHYPRGRSLGIYNCRSVVGGSTTSTHGEGRAVDVGFPMDGGRGSPAGHALVDDIREVADHIGVQAIIYDRTIWSATSPGGRRYTGRAPHYNHVHIELTRAAGRRLNLATLRRWLNDGEEDDMIGLVKGDSGERVKGLQALIQYAGVELERWGVDGDYGDETAEGLRQVRENVGSRALDGYGDRVSGWAYAQLMKAVARRQD